MVRKSFFSPEAKNKLRYVPFLRLVEVLEVSTVQAFCQVLIDYVSAGHFEVYDRLIKESEQFGDKDTESILQRCYPVIQKSTDLAVQFNDTYETFQDQKLFREALSKDMSQLAESLEERFAIEDELIELLHNRHKEKVA